MNFYFILFLRSSEIHLFYNLGDFYWHFLEILWLFIFLFLYSPSLRWSFYELCFHRRVVGEERRKINNRNNQHRTVDSMFYGCSHKISPAPRCVFPNGKKTKDRKTHRAVGWAQGCNRNLMKKWNR